MRVAVLGMGQMGHEVAGRLLGGGHGVTVWNRSRGKADDLVERGALEAGSIAAAVSGAEVVITSLTDDAAVLEVVTGEGGIVSVLEGSTVLVEMSTVSPETAAEVAEASGGRSLAAPILGAPQAVASGAAVYLVAGAKDHFDAVVPVFETLSDQRRYVGEDHRVALQMKLLANFVLLSGIVVLSEVVATAQAVGLDDTTLRSFLEASPLVAPALRNRLDALITGDHASWFTTALGAKDMMLAEEMATREGVRLPLAELVKRRYEEAAAEGFSDLDLTAVAELVRGQRSS